MTFNACIALVATAIAAILIIVKAFFIVHVKPPVVFNMFIVGMLSRLIIYQKRRNDKFLSFQ